MAGAKESPRQKMIGMMYLVLTALLALQVTSAILEKFIVLNNSLEQSTGAVNQANDQRLKSIQAAVEKAGNRPNDVAVFKQAGDVRQITSVIIGEIDQLKQRIVEEAGGGLDETGHIKNASEEEKVAQIMVGPNRNGSAYQLQKNLDSYLQNMGKYSTTKYPSLATDGKDDPIASRSPEQRTKDFAELNFAQTPVPAALAVLSQKQAEIRRIEGETLSALAQKVGAEDVKFDQISAMLSMESKVVVAGTKFKGEMFLAASSSGITPRMSLSGAPVRMDGGKGIIEFTAQGGAYDKNGLARRVLTGSISYNTPAGMKTVPLQAEYFVAKPSYQIETGTLPPLYLGCANKLSVQSPQLGALWNPSFTADGAAVIESGQKGKITIVPSAANVMLNINNAGNRLGSEPFRVNRVPKPTIEYYLGGQKADNARGLPASSARNVRVAAIADESFKNYSPDDANYRVTGLTISLARGTRRVKSVEISGPQGSLGEIGAEAQPGDRLIIEVNGVQRRNFRGEISDASMGRPIQSVGLY